VIYLVSLPRHSQAYHRHESFHILLSFRGSSAPRAGEVETHATPFTSKCNFIIRRCRFAASDTGFRVPTGLGFQIYGQRVKRLLRDFSARFQLTRVDTARLFHCPLAVRRASHSRTGSFLSPLPLTGSLGPSQRASRRRRRSYRPPPSSHTYSTSLAFSADNTS
jgi:hypothetical protein